RAIRTLRYPGTPTVCGRVAAFRGTRVRTASYRRSPHRAPQRLRVVDEKARRACHGVRATKVSRWIWANRVTSFLGGTAGCSPKVAECIRARGLAHRGPNLGAPGPWLSSVIASEWMASRVCRGNRPRPPRALDARAEELSG